MSSASLLSKLAIIKFYSRRQNKSACPPVTAFITTDSRTIRKSSSDKSDRILAGGGSGETAASLAVDGGITNVETSPGCSAYRIFQTILEKPSKLCSSQVLLGGPVVQRTDKSANNCCGGLGRVGAAGRPEHLTGNSGAARPEPGPGINTLPAGQAICKII